MPFFVNEKGTKLSYTMSYARAFLKETEVYQQVMIKNGAQGRNRTTDTRIFNPLLYP